MNNRQIEILQILSENSGKNITSKLLSVETTVSTRTIKSDIKTINEQYPQLIQSSNKGYRIEKEDLTKYSLAIDENALPQSPIERIRYMINALLTDDTKHSLADFSERLYVSNSTIQNDLELIKELIGQYDLELISEKSFLRIKGLEKNKKNLLVNLLYDELETNFFSLNQINQLFPSINIEFIKEIIIKSLSKDGYLINDFGLYSSIIQICVRIDRMRKNINEADYEGIHYYNERQMEVVEGILKELENYFSVTFNQSDYNELSTVLISNIHPFESQKESNNKIEDRIKKGSLELTESILKQINDYFLVDINYEKVLVPFSIHIQNLKERIENEVTNHNPLTDSIKYSSPITYEIAVFASAIIKKEWGLILSEGEIAFMAIHIGSALEFQKIFDNKIKSYLIIPDYHSYSENLIEKINNLYYDELHIVKIVNSFDQLTEKEKPDLIISVLPKPLNLIDTYWLEISMFLTANDQLLIEEKINDLQKQSQQKNLSEKLENITSADLFFMSHQENDSMSHALEVLSQPLVDLQYVDDNFLEEVRKREKLSTTAYPPFAIPHSINMEAKETMMGIYINPKGIDWNGKTVYLVILPCFTPGKRKYFNRIFRVLTDTLVNTQNISSLLDVTSFDQFIENLKTLL